MPRLGYGFATDLLEQAIDDTIAAIIAARVDFDDVLDVNGELLVSATGVGSMFMTGGYVDATPPDANNALYTVTVTANSIRIKNAGGSANAGAAVAGFFS